MSASNTTETPATAEHADPDIADAIAGYRQFQQSFAKDKAFYQQLATAKQKPRLLWIGCSDSRVVPAQIVNADPGELFEVRNIANTVPPSGAPDRSVGAAIEYALHHLGIDDIVVCGHTGCGGVAALAGGELPDHEPHLGDWVEQTRAAHALVYAAKVPAEERELATVKAHLQFQIDNLKTYRTVRERLAAGTLGVHAWLYDMAHGSLLAYDQETGLWQPL